MNTQNHLFENSSQIPEQLYVELMNKLKIDFQSNEVKNTLIVINKNIPRIIVKSKTDMIQEIIRESVNWENREPILLEITRSRVLLSRIQQICKEHGISLKKQNPRWTEQEEIIQQSGVRNLIGRYSRIISF
jgi:hypothetical protein